MIEEILTKHAKDGILAALVIYLLWMDRQDRKEDRKFWSEFFDKHKNNSKESK